MQSLTVGYFIFHMAFKSDLWESVITELENRRLPDK
jgi:hypothetical protein